MLPVDPVDHHTSVLPTDLDTGTSVSVRDDETIFNHDQSTPCCMACNKHSESFLVGQYLHQLPYSRLLLKFIFRYFI